LEYLVKWKDSGDNEWVKAGLIGEDLVRDIDQISVKMEIIGTQFGVKTLAKMASFWLMFSYVYFFPLEGILITCNLKTT
jgi:hypothetical protein